MKTKTPLLIIASLILLVAAQYGANLRGGGSPGPAHEYVTLRWDGRDNTHVIRPGGIVENLAAKFKEIKKPERADDRSFFMNLAVNALARQGYEVVAITPDDYILRRSATEVSNPLPK